MILVKANALPHKRNLVLSLHRVGVKFPIRKGIFNRVKDYFVAVEPINLRLDQS